MYLIEPNPCIPRINRNHPISDSFYRFEPGPGLSWECLPEIQIHGFRNFFTGNHFGPGFPPELSFPDIRGPESGLRMSKSKLEHKPWVEVDPQFVKVEHILRFHFPINNKLRFQSKIARSDKTLIRMTPIHRVLLIVIKLMELLNLHTKSLVGVWLT